jgi:transcriptional regulator with XRE-family HTH domain
VIRELRLQRLLSVTEVAGRIGCHPRSLEYIELERRGASELMIRKIAAALDVKPDEIRRQDVAA